jgi:hypothetical protein
VTEYNWEEWLSQQIKQHGEYMEVVTLPEHRHEFIDPLLELAESVQPTGILVVEAGERQA